MSGRAPRLCVVLSILFVAVAAAPAKTQQSASLDAIRKLLLDARFSEAEVQARALLVAEEAGSGLDSVATAHVIDTLVEALWRGGHVRAPETRPLAERAVTIKERQLGPQHPDVGFSLTSLGIVVRLLGDYPGAKSLFERALAIQEQSLGPDHLDVARTLTPYATLAADMGDLAGGQAMHERALAIRKLGLPPGDAAHAENLNGLGVILERKGDDAGAERIHQQALAIREKALGPAHPDVAQTLNNLGNIKSAFGDYAASRSLHERALAIREKALGLAHPDVAMSLNNLAVATRDLGDHAAAWWLLERVLAIWEKVYGPEHPNVAFACHNLAAILLDLGNEAGTRLLVERARRFRARLPGDDRAPTESLNALVGLDPPVGGDLAARALFERALTIKEKALGPNHTSVALTLTSLANVHAKMGQPAVARPMYERALAIREKAFGPTHPDVADTLDRLGELLAGIGDYAGAKITYERVLTMTEQAYGPDHPNAGVVRQHLAEVLGPLGETSAALQMALDAERIGRDHLRLIGRTLPEREALMYAAMRPMGLDVALTLVTRVERRNEPSRAAVWDAVVRSRAVVLDEMASRHRTVGATDSPELARLVTNLAAAREQLARLVVRGPEGSGEQYRLELGRARDERDAAERALAERSLEFRDEQLQRRIGLGDVTRVLPPRSALIAFVRYQLQSLTTPTATGAPDSSPVAQYLAFVLRAADPANPSVVPLGPALAIEAEIARWRKQMTAVAFSGGRSTARVETAIRQTGALLRAMIWDPLAAEFGDASRVFIVPDGALHLVNWESLPTGASNYLIEDSPLLHYLSAERDLVPREHVAQGQGLLIVDSPVFNESGALSSRVRDASGGEPTLRGAETTGSAFRGGRSGCGDFRSMRFDPLPASAREAQTIVNIWQQRETALGITRLSGRDATEAAVKHRAAGTRVLHLATHGFFLGGRCASASTQAGDSQERNFAPGSDAGENPLLLAGFALSGANRRQSAGQDDEDGILTAEEIAALDLRGVEWAVLSACDTGVGEIRAGEGVFGLRRAFQVAGARTVIMSLWPVDDEDTRRWMTGVYDRRFARGMGTAEAVRDATLEQLKRRRQAGSSTHPFYWGGFIAAGDWR